MNHVMQVESGTFRIVAGDVGSYASRTSEIVDIETRIPTDSKSAVKDVIVESLQNFSDSVTEIVINIPQNLSEFTEIIFELIKLIIGV
jgi:hypothetical protein